MKRITVLLLLTVLVHLVPPQVCADSLAAKRFILEKFVDKLPDSIAHLPWDEFEKHIDPYTNILSPKDLQRWMQRFAGDSEAETGIDYDWVPLGWLVVEVAPHSPAYQAGVMPGDIVTGVNGRAPRWKDANGEYGRYSGTTGEVFVMEILRQGRCTTIAVPLAQYKTESMYVSVINRTMCVVVLDFNYGVSARFDELTGHISERDIDTIILDLRDNAGGSVWETIDLLAQFVRRGDTVLTEQYRSKTNYITIRSDGRWRRPRPLYVLQSKGTVSAGEVFTGAMLMCTNATLIGSATYGKGRIQRFYDKQEAKGFADSTIGAVMVTIARYLSGFSLPVDGRGVPADMPVDLSFAPVVRMPASVDVVALRRQIHTPTRQIIDSINHIVGADVGHMIWCERSRTLEAYRAIDTLRPRLLAKKIVLRPSDVVNEKYMYADESAIGRALRESYGDVLDGYTLQQMPVAKQLERLAKLPVVPRPAVDVLEDDGMSPVSADLGITLTSVLGDLYVARLHPSGSAYEAGLCVGDKVLSVNGKPLSQDLNQARLQLIDIVRKGAPITLRLQRGKQELKLVCEPLMRSTAAPLTYLDGEVGYITSDRFCSTENSVFQIWRELLRMRDRGMKKIVFDLRGSEYGRVDHVVKLLGYFTRQDITATYAWYNSGRRDEVKASGDGNFAAFPVTVVVDRSTKGAAEIFAAAMKRRGNATIVGTPTAGLLYERQTLEVTPTIGVRYIWRRFSDVADSSITPDVRMDLPEHSVLSANRLNAQLRDLGALRRSIHGFSAPDIEAAVQRLPPTLVQTSSPLLFEALFGDGARLYVLAKEMRNSGTGY